MKLFDITYESSIGLFNSIDENYVIVTEDKEINSGGHCVRLHYIYHETPHSEWTDDIDEIWEEVRTVIGEEIECAWNPEFKELVWDGVGERVKHYRLQFY